MKLRVLAFSQVRERIGAGELRLELPAGATCKDLVHALALRHPRAGLGEWLEAGHLRIARNRHHVDSGAALADGDEVALFPPTAGG